MRDVLLLEAPGMNELARAVRAAGGPSCVVHRVAGLDELRRALTGDVPWELVLVPPEPSVLRLVREIDETVPLVAVAERGDVDLASAATAAGASDLLVAGERLHERVATLLAKVRPWVRLREGSRRVHAEARERARIAGESPQIRALLERVERVATVPRPVLIVGERGTGKELVAVAIHDAGGSPSRPLVSVNCAAFPDALLETEIFGHERGAFTGAERRVPGKFELASGGTLFLDEIGCMSLPFQQKILRAVEYGVFTRVGGTEELHSSARVVAATNADLVARIEEGTFLADLYDRLAFEVIRVPPLREREGDVEHLARHFLDAFLAEVPTLRGRTLTDEAIAALRAYPFPGNVRELKHIVERAAYREGPDAIRASDLGLPGEGAPVAGGFEARVEAFQRTLVRDALAGARGNRAAAARSLGLTYDQYRYYLKKLG
jgi:DNA-binding NtrC family response regulator